MARVIVSLEDISEKDMTRSNMTHFRSFSSVLFPSSSSSFLFYLSVFVWMAGWLDGWATFSLSARLSDHILVMNRLHAEPCSLNRNRNKSHVPL